MRIQRQVYSSPLVELGSLRCSVDDQAWGLPDWAREWPGISFPQLPVQIRLDGATPFTADANTAIFLDVDRPFTRSQLQEHGSHAIYFKVTPEVMTDSVRRFDPAAGDARGTLFPHTHGPTNPEAYLALRLLFEHAAGDATDGLRVEEASMQLVDEVVASSFEVRGSHRRPLRPSTVRWRRDVSEEVKRILATRFAEPLTLEIIAREVHSSPFHLSRVFRDHTGIPIHRYLNRLRLRAAIERSKNGELKLARVATEVGFARHSHLTQACRREFGRAPSEIRSHLSRGSLPDWLQ